VKDKHDKKAFTQLMGSRISLVFLFILSFTLNQAYASEPWEFASLKDLGLEELPANGF